MMYTDKQVYQWQSNKSHLSVLTGNIGRSLPVSIIDTLWNFTISINIFKILVDWLLKPYYENKSVSPHGSNINKYII